MSTFLTFFPGLHPVQSITAFQSFKELPALKPPPRFRWECKGNRFYQTAKKMFPVQSILSHLPTSLHRFTFEADGENNTLSPYVPNLYLSLCRKFLQNQPRQGFQIIRKSKMDLITIIALYTCPVIHNKWKWKHKSLQQEIPTTITFKHWKRPLHCPFSFKNPSPRRTVLGLDV